MPFTTEQLVIEVKRFANQHYESDGWDYVVETWSNDDIASIVRGSSTPAMAIGRVKREIAPLAEMRDEIRAASGEY